MGRKRREQRLYRCPAPPYRHGVEVAIDEQVEEPRRLRLDDGDGVLGGTLSNVAVDQCSGLGADAKLDARL
jgi:hypothetical protein